MYIYGADSKVLKFNKVHMRTYRRSGLLISKFVNVNIKMYKSDKIKMYNYSKLT